MKNIVNTINSFRNDMVFIFEQRLIDIIIYGSVIRGDFDSNKSDIDFIVLVQNELQANDITIIKDYMTSLREKDDSHKKLEGVFISVDDKYAFLNGYYVGTNIKGWKEVKEIPFIPLERAMILNKYQSLLGTEVIRNIIPYNWKDVENDINEQISMFDDTLKKQTDKRYTLYAVKTSVRSLYTTVTKDFASKSGAINWLIGTGKYTDYHNLLNYVKKYSNPLNDTELQTIDFTKYDVERFMKQIYVDIMHITKGDK